MGDNFVILKPKEREIWNSEYFLSLEINLKFKKNQNWVLLSRSYSHLQIIMFTLAPMANVTLISIYQWRLFNCLVCHVKISQTTMHSTMHLLLLESLWCVRLHWDGLKNFNLFYTGYWKLNNFVKENMKKNKTKKFREIGCILRIVGKPWMRGISWKVFHKF
jgi:hypothetical protein